MRFPESDSLPTEKRLTHHADPGVYSVDAQNVKHPEGWVFGRDAVIERMEEYHLNSLVDAIFK